MNRRNVGGLLLMATVTLALGLSGAASAGTTYSGTTAITFSVNPATLSGDNTPDVTITTTTTAPGASQALIDAGRVTVQVATDGVGNPVPAASVVTWVALNAPGQYPASGVTTLDVDLDGLGCLPGTFVGFRAHYVTGGGADKVDTHFATPVDLEIAAPEDEGLSHGFWKNHAEDWVGYSPDDVLGDVFTLAGSFTALGTVTLDAALDFGGGPGPAGAAQILLRNAVASVLNAAHPNIDYPLSLAQVIAAVNAALATEDPDTMLALEDALDEYNNLGGDIDS